jgi:uncharacterized coiled-coil protein SlyX
VAADWDSSGTDARADTIEISETSTAATADAYDVDPDTENYAAGNDPDIAYRNQGRADSPNGWSSYVSADGYQENDDYAEGTGEHDEPQEEGAYDGDTPDLWGDTDPDAANYAELDGIGAGAPDGEQGPQEDLPETDRDGDADADRPSQDPPAQADADQAPLPDQQRTSPLEAGQPDQAESAVADTGERLSPEQQRIDDLEAQNADAKQTIADLQEKNADANQQIADLKAELEAVKNERATLSEQVPARTDGYQGGGETTTPDHGADEPDGARDQDASRADRKRTDQRADANDAEPAWWRRAGSAENVGAVGTLLGAADLAMHGMPGVAVALGATAIGVASWGQVKIEKHRKGKP